MATSEQHVNESGAAAAGESAPDTVGPPRKTRLSRTGMVPPAVLLAVIAAAVGVAAVSATPTPSPAAVAQTAAPQDGQPDEEIVAPQPVTPHDLAALPQATTDGTVPEAPPDRHRDAAPSGKLVHPSAAVAVYASPGGAPIAALPPTEFGSDTWVPVIAEQPGWVQVLLPVRPNGASGWIYSDDPAVTLARTPFRIVVDRGAFTLSLVRDGRQVGQWRVGVGKAASPTPAGRTFVLAYVRPDHPTYSSLILPLGSHSDTYLSYGGASGTTGIHAWTYTDSVLGTQSSDGCIRVPQQALDALVDFKVPVGTPVLIK
ncbi:L,D-transpeptidase family protein [Amycolatopsis sp. VC5-11]|uniref:L,D-transpeptidase family protein n=1 Tax=Amycolatopsis sp. VC5-11 TaxID=3120156 RepID=UPI003009CDF4